ncbi:BGTF surface domain-containing protein [Haloprofundus halobius]|uniref:BGTF surface domain-containing protein n=1 Tax=Haloprofundus halobius TaxID=2876194 RepID=UPI001CC9B647|nr:BGTF surface domain-containing protein [Haloprofundus halobius]
MLTRAPTRRRLTRGLAALLVLLSAAAASGTVGAADTTTADGDDIVILHEGDRLVLEAAEAQVVRGETTLDAGTELTVRIRSAHGADAPFLESRTTEVDEYGTFEATFDLSGQEVDTAFTASAYGDDLSSEDVDGRLVSCADCDASSTRTTLPPADEASVEPVVRVRRTNTARIPVTYGDADRLTLVVGGEDVNYEAVVTVRDGDGDGRTTVRFDTADAGSDSQAMHVRDDQVVTHSQTTLGSTLDPGDYPMRLYLGSDTDGEPVDVGTLSVVDVPELTSTSTPETTPETEARTETVTETSSRSLSTVPRGVSSLLGGVGALVAGGLLAVLGIGLLLGVFRT